IRVLFPFPVTLTFLRFTSTFSICNECISSSIKPNEYAISISDKSLLKITVLDGRSNSKFLFESNTSFITVT
uniref:hypothetical protein n=1 Tax=Acinetobacter baumannii TaxID=470 RepID=UPI001C07C8F7